MARKIVLATRPESEAHTLAFSNFMKNHRRCRPLTLSVFYIHPLGRHARRSRELRRSSRLRDRCGASRREAGELLANGRTVATGRPHWGAGALEEAVLKLGDFGLAQYCSVSAWWLKIKDRL